MRTVEKERTWNDNWNNVIRYVLFRDEKLKKQMLVPDGVRVNEFILKYFVKDAAADELLVNEKVRIVYYDRTGWDTGNKNVKLRYKEFDIYVKEDVLYNATDDTLKSRANLISERQQYLLTKDDTIQHLRFAYEDDFDMWTKTVGYKRYHIIFSYKTTV